MDKYASYDDAKKQELEKLDNELEALEEEIDEKLEFFKYLMTKYSSIIKLTPKEQQ
ncbi:TPA: hypothetical protein RPW15_001716 [Campylobacter fetus subsp. venerealis]|uniref:Uncharacterized protein n=2 Tax=Campylobacter fetus subsp. venerealis TaxID=32020 RepID=A0AAE6IZB7_CAMFE|nr:hypothetical protein [Campylobacter fetus]ACS15159.1 hypothetical protein [Campylobacter fetus subsp. venerealis NCTC 10354]AHE94541.1 hypothetical protein CFVI03293_1237 [Campylobacter fetus subsp. venerealis cfvi03/293]AIR80912.1 hypothetical protein CFV97608_1294 [Campylobacter fetus subsp. venerealis 97/608]EGU24813.1 hypothetical protein CFV354_1918 [Campylobacter fetus subsp. venerealis NCTC 10354]MBK3487584.1 hypothetical protein [Campylobacter fetus subsp. venerealis]